MTSGVREATLDDVPQIADVFASGFIDDELFGDLIHPRRREYYDDYLSWWKHEIRTHLFEPAVLMYVRADESNVVRACCVLRRLGKGAEARTTDVAFLERVSIAVANKMDDLTVSRRSLDPDGFEKYEKNWEDIAHHFTGPRAEVWMIELFCVAPESQRGGHGRAIIQNAIQLAKSEDVPLCVIASSVGDAFYGKMGFYEIGRANIGSLSMLEGGSLKVYERHLQR